MFHNSHEFIKKNKPRFFIFENVKGLLSHERNSKDSKEIGKTFQTWINYLGGKSINGNPVIFPMEEAVHYHIYWTVLNTKNFGIPQNRERVFIVGIRDDEDNVFSWPQEVPLIKKLKDVLQDDVDEKYFLSDKMVSGLKKEGNKEFINQDTQASSVFSSEGTSPTLSSGTHGYAQGYIKVTSATSKGYEEAKE